MKKTHLVITTPEGIFFDHQVYQVVLKTADGYRGFLASHAPAISSVEISELRIYREKESEPERFAISGGLVFVDSTIVEIITVNIEAQQEIDILRAEREKAEILSLITAKGRDQLTLKTQIHLLKVMNRIYVYNHK